MAKLDEIDAILDEIYDLAFKLLLLERREGEFIPWEEVEVELELEDSDLEVDFEFDPDTFKE